MGPLKKVVALSGYYRNPTKPAELRRLVQTYLGDQYLHGADVLTHTQLRQAVEDLEIQRLELHQQNQHLNEARAQLEAALNQSRDLYDFAPVACFNLGLGGSITRVNLACSVLLGAPRAQLLGQSFEDYLLPHDVVRLRHLLAQALLSPDGVGQEFTLVCKQPRHCRVQLKLGAMPDKQGFHVMLVDISERTLSEERLRENEERWKLALEAAGDGVWDWNLGTGAVSYSERFLQLYGLSAAEFGNTVESWSKYIHPDDRAQVMADTQAHLMGKTPLFINEHREQCADGSWRWLLCRGAVVSRHPDGSALRMVGTHVDITSRKHMEEALKRANHFQQAVFDSLSSHIAVLDRHGHILQTNAAWQAFVRTCGFADMAGLLGTPYAGVLHCLTGTASEAALAGLTAVMAGTAPQFDMEYRLPKDGKDAWFMLRVRPARALEDRVVVSHQDITLIKQAELASLTLANFDALTGVLSRRHFLDVAEQELSRATRYGVPLVVLMLDLDHFKHINDEYGHAAGDMVLQGFVKAVGAVLRDSDVMGRIGGEEFSVLLPNTSLDGGLALAQRVVEQVRHSPVAVDGKSVTYTVSIGVSSLTKEVSFAALLKLADTALYKAKAGGRDGVQVVTAGNPNPGAHP